MFRHSTVIGAQGGFEHAAREVACDNRLPHLPKQHETETTIQDLLVHRHVLKEILRLHLGRRHHRQPGSLQKPDGAITIRLADPAELRGHLKRHHGSRRYRLTMQPDPITHMSLYSMAKGMAQVEGGAHTRFSLVRIDHLGLGCTGTVDRLGQRQ